MEKGKKGKGKYDTYAKGEGKGKKGGTDKEGKDRSRSSPPSTGCRDKKTGAQHKDG